jgi:ATP-dependent RNA helicase DDX23/PRP28
LYGHGQHLAVVKFTMSNGTTDNMTELIPAHLLATLSPEEQKEALEAALIAKKAEERAEQRALEKALLLKEESRRKELEKEKETTVLDANRNRFQQRVENTINVKFISKKYRNKDGNPQAENESSSDVTIAKLKPQILNMESRHQSAWSEEQKHDIQKVYLGKRAVETEEDTLEQRRKEREKKKITFKFQWDDTEDTSNLDRRDDIYTASVPLIRKPLTKRRRNVVQLEDMPSATMSLQTVLHKPLESMTKRDWRIFRETFDILVKGGKCPPPLRRFDESPDPENVPSIHPSILQALQRTFQFVEPSPIQRQAIPIGMQRRDLIGIAETGSGKTVAFGVPLCHYVATLPPQVLQRVAEDGPLAIVLAPTRELALQIDAEFQKILSFMPKILSMSVVGGQPIQNQAQKLRQGVHIVVGTPGRMNDCLEMSYMVLNQCCYVVLDEFDRTLDMGFLPQTISILDAMGGKLKSENEIETYDQERKDLVEGNLPAHRVTAMFSATITPDVEKVAEDYLRHPVHISIGDNDSRKNTRIVQHVLFLSSPAQKESALRDALNKSRSPQDKVIVFVNEKKHTEGVRRIVERCGRRCVVLHGGKSQGQREESLAEFSGEGGSGVVLVATDVAGRGLDIPNVSHVINYDLPTRSIDNYSHRIGRTGRAGKDGLATSFITDADEGIMADLKRYLESTGNVVPERLARHPAAISGHGKNII